MKLTLHSYESVAPPKKSYKAGVDYQIFESEVEPDEILAYFDRLIYPRDSFYIEVAEYLVDFWKHEESLWVEITGANFWATSKVSRDEAKAIIKRIQQGKDFSGVIPATSREWDAYALLGEGELTTDAAI